MGTIKVIKGGYIDWIYDGNLIRCSNNLNANIKGALYFPENDNDCNEIIFINKSNYKAYQKIFSYIFKSENNKFYPLNKKEPKYYDENNINGQCILCAAQYYTYIKTARIAVIVTKNEYGHINIIAWNQRNNSFTGVFFKNNKNKFIKKDNNCSNQKCLCHKDNVMFNNIKQANVHDYIINVIKKKYGCSNIVIRCVEFIYDMLIFCFQDENTNKMYIVETTITCKNNIITIDKINNVKCYDICKYMGNDYKIKCAKYNSVKNLLLLFFSNGSRTYIYNIKWYNALKTLSNKMEKLCNNYFKYEINYVTFLNNNKLLFAYNNHKPCNKFYYQICTMQ